MEPSDLKQQDGPEPRTLTITGMTCQACAGAVARALQGVEGVRSADVSYAASSASVRAAADVTPEALAAAVASAGYGVLDETKPLAERVRELRARDDATVRRLGLEAAGAAAMLAVVLASMVAPLPHGVPLAAATAAVVLAGGRTIVLGTRALLRGSPDMNTLVALASVAALAGGWATGDHGHLHAAVMILAFVLFGRWLEGRTKRRVGTAVERLFDLAPDTARVLRRGEEVEVPLDEVRAGNLVLVRPGERVPVDGQVTDGRSDVDTALLTGESVPRPVAPGDSVLAGAVNGTGALSLRATAVGRASALERIAAAIHRAQSTAAPVQRLADKVSAIFVPVVLGVAALALAVALARGMTTAAAVSLAVGVLVVACPCALGLATPIAILAATDRASRAGHLVRDAALFERLAKVDLVAFDKTGTLSRGAPRLEAVRTLAEDDDADELLTLAAAVEARSEQPLARAVVEAARDRSLAPRPVADFRALPGRGVVGTVGEHAVSLLRPAEVGAEEAGRAIDSPVPASAPRASADGSMHADEHGSSRSAEGLPSRAKDSHDAPLPPRLDPAATERARALADELGNAGLSPVVLLVDDAPRAVLGFRDPPHERAASVVGALRERGLELLVLSGDDPRAVTAFANELGLDDALGGVTPEEKADAVSARTRAGHRVLFVGDGVNDAPALAAAEVGLAQGHGADVAIEAADAAWLGRGVPDVAGLVDLARETRRTIAQNLGWAFAYNLVALPLASGLLLPWIPWTPPPALSAMAMAASSLLVVGNGYRLKRRA